METPREPGAESEERGEHNELGFYNYNEEDNVRGADASDSRSDEVPEHTPESERGSDRS